MNSKMIIFLFADVEKSICVKKFTHNKESLKNRFYTMLIDWSFFKVASADPNWIKKYACDNEDDVIKVLTKAEVKIMGFFFRFLEDNSIPLLKVERQCFWKIKLSKRAMLEMFNEYGDKLNLRIGKIIIENNTKEV